MSNLLRHWISLTESLVEAIERAEIYDREVILYRDPTPNETEKLLSRYKHSVE